MLMHYSKDIYFDLRYSESNIGFIVFGSAIFVFWKAPIQKFLHKKGREREGVKESGKAGSGFEWKYGYDSSPP